MNSESQLSDLKRQIRDFIQHPRRMDPLLRDKALWFRLTSAMDAIEDTEIAIDAYIVSPEPDRGGAYLLIYGVLQALFVQQDAIRHLVEAFEIVRPAEPELLGIREIRNCTIGHPTSVAARKAQELPASSNFIVQMTVTKQSFQFMRAFEDGETSFTEVDIVALIKKQRAIVTQVLQDVWRILQEREQEHRDQYKNQKLEALFPAVLNYMFEQIAKVLWAGGSSNRMLGLWGIQGVAKAVDDLRSALEARGIVNGSSHTASFFQELEHPITEITKYMEGTPSFLSGKSAPVYLFYIREKLDDLKEMAREIDREYATQEDSDSEPARKMRPSLDVRS